MRNVWILMTGALWLLGHSGSAWAIKEDEFSTRYATDVRPTIEKNASVGAFLGKDGKRIEYLVVEPALEEGQQAPKGALIILPGRSESLYKYFEVAYDLRHLGLRLYLMEHRGQGASDRLIDDRQKGHVGNFQDYVDDLGTFLHQVVQKDGFQTVFVLAHSMGGTIATLYAEQHPADLSGLVVSSPMMQIDTGKYNEAAAYLLTAGLTVVGKGQEYAPGFKPSNPAEEVFETALETSSRPRWEMWRDLRLERPELVLGGQTNRFCKESLEATWQVQVEAGKLTVPMLLLQSGNDSYVKPAGQDRVCRRAARCEKIRIEEGRHELLMDRDVVRDRAMDAIERFLTQRLSAN